MILEAYISFTSGQKARIVPKKCPIFISVDYIHFNATANSDGWLLEQSNKLILSFMFKTNHGIMRAMEGYFEKRREGYNFSNTGGICLASDNSNYVISRNIVVDRRLMSL